MVTAGGARENHRRAWASWRVAPLSGQSPHKNQDALAAKRTGSRYRHGFGRRRENREIGNRPGLIRELSKVCSDQAIAATLNRLGCRTGAGETWRVHSVHNARYYYRLPNYRTSKQWLTIEQASQEMKVSATVIKRLIKTKILPAQQVVQSTPWIIARQDLSLPAVQAEIQAVRQGRQLKHNDANQNELSFESTSH